MNMLLFQKINEYRKQNAAHTKEIKTLEEGIKKYEDVQNVNKFYKSKIHKLEENMKQSKIVIKEKEDSVTNRSNKLGSLKQMLSRLEDNIGELIEDLELSMSAKDVLAGKVLKHKLLYEDER